MKHNNEVKYNTGKTSMNADVLSHNPIDDCAELPAGETAVMNDSSRDCTFIPNEKVMVGACVFELLIGQFLLQKWQHQMTVILSSRHRTAAGK